MNQDQRHNPEEDIRLGETWRVLKRRKWTVGLVFFPIVLIAAVITLGMTPVYRASVTLFIDQESSNVLTISENNVALGAQSYATYKEYYQSQKEIIQSRRIVEQVFAELDLDEAETFTGQETGIKASLREFLGKPRNSASREKRYEAWLRDALAEFREDISVTDVRNTRLLRLNVENTDPVLAARIANRIAEIYVERNLAYISKSEILNLHKNEYLKLQAKLSEFSKTYKDKHPKILRVKRKLEELKKKIKQEQVDQRPGAAPIISSSVLAGLKANNISVQEWAEPDFNPVRPDKRRNLLLAVILGLFGGVGAAFVRETLDDSLKSAEDVIRQTGWPFLGYIPRVRRREGLLKRFVHFKPKSALSETYRSIRTGLLLFSKRERPLQSFLITSAGEREGKSTTASNLAIAMAQNNKKVLLVDADMRKPSLHRLHKLDKKKGLSSFLSGKLPFDEIAQTTKVENLTFIGSGPKPPNPSELLGSEKMEEFLALAKGRFDHIFFDSPPMMVVTDAVVLCRIVDGLIIVMESGKVSPKILPIMKHKVDFAGVRVAGFIMNKIKSQAGDFDHFYEYYGRA